MADSRYAGKRGRPRARRSTAFAADWYRKLDEHVPRPEIAPLVLDQGLEFVVPEATLRAARSSATGMRAAAATPG